jgi:hypothetical protein
MTRNIVRRFWPGILALAWLLHPSAAHAWGPNTPLPIGTDSVFIYRFDVKIGPSAFARPAGPWYSYFPVDPNLLAQPRAAAFPNWPNQFPPAPTPTEPMVRPPGMTYYQPMQYGYGVYPATYYQAQPGYWYGR